MCLTDLCSILNDGDFDELDSNPLSSATFVSFQNKPLVQHQSFIVGSGLHKASVMRSVTRAPAFIQTDQDRKSRGSLWEFWVHTLGRITLC